MIVIFKIICLILIEQLVWAIPAVELGGKYYLPKSKEYHFSSKDLISHHLDGRRPFVVGLKIGTLKYRADGRESSLLILNSDQMKFYEHNKFIVEHSPFLDWAFKTDILLVKGRANEMESKILLDSCTSNSRQTIGLELEGGFIDPKLCPGHAEEFKIDIAVLSSQKLSGKTYGLGIPIELGWRGSPDPALEQVGGSVRAGKTKASVAGHSFFSTVLEQGAESVFESGSDVLIRPQGRFNNQPNEWRRATSRLKALVLESDKNLIKTQVDVDVSKRSGESDVFDVQRFQKTLHLEDGRWVQIFVFSEKGSEKTRVQPLGLNLFGQRNKSNSKQTKEVWIKVKRRG